MSATITPPAPRFVSGPHASADGDPAVVFRRELVIGPGLLSATLRVTALGVVETWVNGDRVGDELLAPGWTSYRHRLMVSSHDVTDLLVEGANVLGAMVGEGWAVGPLTWDNTRHNYADRAALYARLELVYPDRTEVVGTDERFRVGTGAVRASGIYAGETYDARLESDWHQAGFDDADWAPAAPFAWNLATLQDPVAPPIRRIEELSPAAVTTSPSGRTVVDFGQNISGWVRLTVDGERGQEIVLRHVEILTPEGEIEPETNRSAAATDRYTLRGGGPETWEPRFSFHGFRYVQVDGWPGTLDAGALQAVVVHSDMARTGWFRCSDPLVNRLHENTVWSMRDNFVGLPTDCPQRDERLGWTGDLNAFTPTATFLYDVRGVLGSWLLDLAAEQKEQGTVPWSVPDVLTNASPPTALWSDVAVSLPWALYQEYADPEILRRAYDSMTTFMRDVESRLDARGLWSEGFQFGDWLDPDAPTSNPAGGKTDAHLVASAYLCRTTRELARTAELLGHVEDAEHFGALADRVRAAFRREYVTEAGRVAGETATGYALTIMFDILDEEQRATAGHQLAGLVEKARYTIATGFAGTPLVTEALSSTGHLDHAYTLLLQQECPSFLYPVTQGATTIWERWDSVLPDGRINSTGMTSLNHYALGAVADWLHRVVGGLQRLEPGWRRFRVAPQPGGSMTSAEISHDTVLGRAEVVWQVAGNEVLVDVLVPAGATAEVVLPLHPDGQVVEVGSGRHSWRYAKPAGYAEVVPVSLDTPLRQIQQDQELWSRLLEVFSRHLPGVPIEAGMAQLGDLTPALLVERTPGDTAALAAELTSTLTPTEAAR